MIDIVVPAYRGLAQTRTCLESVLANPQRANFELVVVDDASPEPALSAWLGEMAAAGRITLLRNESNRGFVQSVNRGMALHPDRDVVLLNSDTEVANDWLDRLVTALERDEKIATVTPLSNNATICSYPFEGWPDGLPGTLGLAGLDRVVAAANPGRAIELPTAVGFCMLIARRALAQLGLFDAARFGRGYGEENDFCMRAMKAGWKHVLAADVFVYHEGSVSFSEERFALIKTATAALLEAHPDYPTHVHAFLRRDPAAPLRAAIDQARAAHGTDEARCVIDERAMERERLLAGLWQIEKLAEERDGAISQLDHALQHATAHISERDRLLAQREAEIEALRQGLAHAESLAFAREAELTQIKRSRMWAWAQRLRRFAS